MTSADNYADQQRCDDLAELIAERPMPPNRLVTLTDVRGPMTVSDYVKEYGHKGVPAEIALAEADRTIQRLHDAALELQDRLEIWEEEDAPKWGYTE
jgi:hypothetical protein